VRDARVVLENVVVRAAASGPPWPRERSSAQASPSPRPRFDADTTSRPRELDAGKDRSQFVPFQSAPASLLKVRAFSPCPHAGLTADRHGGAVRLSRPTPPSILETDLWWPRSLAFLVPFEAGERVVVVGASPSVARSACAAGARGIAVLSRSEAVGAGDVGAGEIIVMTDARTIPLPDESADHVVVPELHDGVRRTVPGEVARVVRPGGSVAVGFHWRVRAPRKTAAITVRGAVRKLRRAGFGSIRAYGVRPSLHQPCHLVPMDSRRGLGWYTRVAYRPGSRRWALAVRLIRVHNTRLAMVLFPAFVLTARRHRGGS
jgi:hypothetical protein